MVPEAVGCPQPPKNMKKNIHPKYHSNAKITCSCGAVLETGSVRETMQSDICSQCHPLYTGKTKMIDSTGRVDRFKKLAQKATTKKESRKTIKTVSEKKQAKVAKKEKK